MDERSAGRIFISYRRVDTPHVAGRLFDRLETRFGTGNVFMDVDSIKPGRDFVEAIEDAVGHCDVLLALIGPHWLGADDEHGRRRLDDPDDFVALEIITALRREIQVIPVLVDGAAPPRRDALPATLAPLARLQGVRLDHVSFGVGVAELMTALDVNPAPQVAQDYQPRSESKPGAAPEPAAEKPPDSGPVSRAMTKELFFLASSAAPLHDAAAELRRAGYLVRGQPRDLDGRWSLMAYSAASKLSAEDLATLDGIAECCGVDFDGWGTYVGPPDLDDGPGKPSTRAELIDDPPVNNGKGVPPGPLAEHQLIGHTGAVSAVAIAQLHGRPVVVSSGDDKTVRVWDLTTGQQLRSMPTGDRGHVHSVAAVQLEGRPLVVSGGVYGTVRVWDLATGRQLWMLRGGDDRVYSVATALLKGQTVVFGSSDKVRAWNMATGRPLMFRLPRRTGRVQALAVTEQEGRTVVISGGSDSTVRVWDLAGQPVGSPFTGHTSSVSALATAELEGRPVVVSGSDDKTVRVWDLATGQQLRSLRIGADGYANSVASTQLRGQTVVITGGFDGVRVWDLATGEPVCSPFTGHTDAVSAVTAVELDGRPVAISGSADTTVRVWDLAARVRS